MAVIYRIKDWDQHYECSDTKKVKSFSRYVPVPNRMDGSGFAQLMNHPNGVAHYGAWITLVIVASKCETRGVLAHKNGEGFDTETLSLMTRVPVKILDELLPRLLSKKIDWMEVVDEQGNCVTDPNASERIRIHPNVSESNLLEEKRGEEIRGEENTPPKSPKGDAWKDLIPESLRDCQETIGEWIAYKAERGKAYKPRGLKGLVTQLTEWGPQRTAAAIRHSIASNYDGVFEPRAGPGSRQTSGFFDGISDFVSGGGNG